LGIAAFTAIAIVSYTVFGLCVGRAAGHIDATLSTVILNGLGAVLPLVYFVILKWGLHRDLLGTSTRGLTWSLVAGVAIGAFSIGLINVVARGGVSYGLPMIYGGTLVLGAIGSRYLLNERISTMHVLGLVVTAAGVGIIALAQR
jgi:transporter family protein